MKNFDIIPIKGNPTTAQIILFNKNEQKKSCKRYCNDCDFLRKIPRPGQSTFNCRCKLNKIGSTATERVIGLKLYEGEKIEAPDWCMLLNSGSKAIEIPCLPVTNNSAMSDEQLRAWNESKEKNRIKELWCSISGITAWRDIKIGKVYHIPPSLKRGRMDVEIEKIYSDSMFGHNIKNRDNVWIYKEDEDYKFMSEVK